MENSASGESNRRLSRLVTGPTTFPQPATAGVASNPPEPAESFDPSEPGTKKRVHRGGSYLCPEQYFTRGKGEEDTGTNHLGFRCVRASR